MKSLIIILSALFILACETVVDDFNHSIEIYSVKNSTSDILIMESQGRSDTTTYYDTLSLNCNYELFSYNNYQTDFYFKGIILHGEDVKIVSIYNIKDSLLYKWIGEGDSFVITPTGNKGYFSQKTVSADTSFYLLEIKY